MRLRTLVPSLLLASYCVAASGAGTTSSVCIAASQQTGNAGSDIAACIAQLPPDSGDIRIPSGGIVDATGYTGNQVINGLTVDRPIILRMSAANFNFTGILNATNLPGGIQIEGANTVFTCNTGAGKPCLDLVGTSNASINDVVFVAGKSNPSTIGVLEGRSSYYGNTEEGQFNHVQFYMGSSSTANNAQGTVAVYNYGAEVTAYHGITAVADNPVVFTSSNIFHVPSPDVPYFTKGITMSSIIVDADSRLYGTNEAMLLDNAMNADFELGEVLGANVVGVPGVYAIVSNGNVEGVKIRGEFEAFYRILHVSGSFPNGDINITCSSCQTSPFSGTLTTSNGRTVATASTASGLAAGQLITATGVPTGATITAVSGTMVTMSAAATATGTVSASMGEPMIVLDGSGPILGGGVSYSSFRIFDAPSTGVAIANFIQSQGNYIQSSTGWTAYLTPGSNIAWTSSDPVNQPISGTIIEPFESGLPDPVISPRLYGVIYHIDGSQVLGNASASDLIVSGTDSSTSVQTYPNLAAGQGNPSVQANDAATFFSIGGAQQTGGYFIGPYSSTPAGMRMSNNGWTNFITGASINNHNIPGAAALYPPVNHVVCWKTTGWQPTIGYCSSAVGADGSCTCN